MRLICKCQHALVVAYREGDSGEFVFTCCRRGFEKALGRKMKVGESVRVDVSVREILAAGELAVDGKSL